MRQTTSIHDPRVARSKQRLREALIELTLEQGWNSISVQRLCERAGVGRSTFYVHYADREELLLGTFQSEHVVPTHVARTQALAFVQPLVEHVAAHRRLYEALVGSECESAMLRRFRQVVSELIERELAAGRSAGPQRTAAVRYLTGAFYETLTHWLDQRAGPSAPELARTLKRYSRPVLERVQ